jgi:EAL domain-containing protein (putative c-di-GMP-specific phosphodiesterase class I)
MSQPVDVPPMQVVLQPVVDLIDGRVIGAEALLRFREPSGDLVSPAKGGLIDRIEADPIAVVRLMEGLFGALSSIGPRLFAQSADFYISINVPPVILGWGVVGRVLKEAGLEAYRHRIVAEITERQALTDAGREVLALARQWGLRVAIDDFGTGESGLRQIMGIGFDVLKLDRSLVVPVMRDPQADRLVRGVVALAGALRVKLVAEGVETREQAFFLRAAGVDAGQGWYWSKALPPDAFEKVLNAGFPAMRRWDEPA